MKRTLICSTILAMTPAIALAQSADEDATATQTGDAQQENQTQVTALSEWAYDDLYGAGWTAETMFDETDIVGATGEEIGSVENVLIGADGNILSLIAEVGGFWDIGDTHVSVPWEEVTMGTDLSEITIPVTEENVDDYSIFTDEAFFYADEADETQVVSDDLYTGQRVFKATELMGDYAYLTGDEQYGYVSDLVFGGDGQLMAVLVDASAYGTPGAYAYPYYGYPYGWHPNMARYTLPYGAEDVAVVDTFDYAEVESMPADWDQDEMATGAVDADETDDMDEETME